MSALAQLQEELGVRLRRGEPWKTLEQNLIEPSDLTEEHKSALWLYGWAHLEDGPLRREHRRELALD